MLDRIVIVGAGRTTDSLVQRLSLVAPVTVLDTSGPALEALQSAPPSSKREVVLTPLPAAVDLGAVLSRHPIQKLAADGTSRLVLEDLRGPSEVQVALVAATGEDRTNLEICRLGTELEYRPVVAIVIDPAQTEKYDALGARTIVRATLLGDVLERALRYDGIAVATSVGLGKGDVLEVRVLPTSPFIGQPLSSLDPDRWRIAAIYRKGELVIPTGVTTINADDRVLLVGDPEILPRIAEDLRLGNPDFPLHFGPNVVVFLPEGASPTVDKEATTLGARTRAKTVIRVAPNTAKDSLESMIERVIAARPGVVLTASSRRGLGDRLLGRSGRNGRLCDRVGVPVLFAGGTPELKRVVMIVAAGMPHLRVADVAIDLSRMLDVPLVIETVELPAYLGIPGDTVEHAAAGVRKRAELHRLVATTVRLQGNPIAEVVAAAKPDDLLIATRKRGARDSFSSPDLALRIASEAPCSTLVVTE